MQARISSADFAEWVAYLTDEPDMGRRADGLAAVLAAHLGRIEATLGGKPLQVSGRLIEWGGAPEVDEEDLATALEGLVKRGEHITRD